MKSFELLPWGTGAGILFVISFLVGGAMFARQSQWQNEVPLFEEPDNNLSPDAADPVFPEMLSRSAVPNIQSLINTRDLFAPLPEENEGIVVQPEPAMPPLVVQFRVVGIMMDAVPMVILEDVQSHQTTIVQQGQKINDAMVESIQSDRVILNVQGQKQELLR